MVWPCHCRWSIHHTLIVGGLDLFRSTNGGTNWTQISNGQQCNRNTLSAPCSCRSSSTCIIPASSSTVLSSMTEVFIIQPVGTAGTSNVILQKNNATCNQFFLCFYILLLQPIIFSGRCRNEVINYNCGTNSTTQVTGGDGLFAILIKIITISVYRLCLKNIPPMEELFGLPNIFQ